MLAMPLALAGCSYSYDLKAVVIGGRLAFVVDSGSNHAPSCFNAVEVIAQGGVRAKASPGDDTSRVQYGTFWNQRLDYGCVDEFPLFYGQYLMGKPNTLGQGPDSVAAKPLRVGVIYEVFTTSGATGYGSGAFKILPDHRVVNVSSPSMIDASEEAETGSTNGRESPISTIHSVPNAVVHWLVS